MLTQRDIHIARWGYTLEGMVVVEPREAWEPPLSSESDMARVDCTSPESDLYEHSFVTDYFGVSADCHTLGLGFAGLVEADETVDWEALEVWVMDETYEAKHDVR